MRSCYVHIPFCDSICYYCDFCRFSNLDRKEWFAQIQKEIRDKEIGLLDTLYFGGGTPSLLTSLEFEQLASLFSVSGEWTVECNPESLTEEKISLYKRLGVNRISLGVQTFHDSLLKSLNRKHTVKDIYRCIETLKQYGIENISIDLIYGLPNQTLQDVKEDIQQFLDLDIPHLSIYSLQIEENSVFGKKGIIPCDEDLEASMYEYICEALDDSDYQHYEISSFCKEGMFSRHNLVYWQDFDFIGIGLGASGKENGIRYDNTKSLKEYLTLGPCPTYIEESDTDRAFNAIMMALRTSFGLNINAWNERYSMNFLKKYKSVLEKYAGYFLFENGYIKPTLSAMEILNTILVDFLMID